MNRRNFLKTAGTGTAGLTGLSGYVRVDTLTENDKITQAASVEILNTHPTVLFAASELEKYLRAMTGNNLSGCSIRIGLFGDFKMRSIPILADPVLDDAISINIIDGAGMLSGSNPRSVLLAVYRYLFELGCRWIRPGKEGEIIPDVSPQGTSVILEELASYRHRTICIEGAVSLSNVVDTIDFLPKLGYNAFFMQFREGFIFFDRWYSRSDSAEKGTFDRKTAEEYTFIIENEISKRSMLYHKVGHGWHTEAFGVPGIGWGADVPVTEEFNKHLAVVHNMKMIPWGIPMLAALCYSDPEVQQAITDHVVEYAKNNTGIDYLHVWLDDYSNNKCECSRCTSKRPYDWYIEMLNTIDEKLTKLGLETKIVFLAYCDLLWPPKSGKINHPGRFLFMYANSRADYSQSLPLYSDAKLPVYEYNRWVPEETKSNAIVSRFILEWKNYYKGEKVIFEYYGKHSSTLQSQVIHEDIKNLHELGFSGLINCQALRVYFPTGIGMTVMGRTMWNNLIPFHEILDDFFRSAYGKNSRKVLEFFNEHEPLLEIIKKHMQEKDLSAASEKASILKTMLDKMNTLVEDNLRSGLNPAIKTSWRMFQKYVEILSYIPDFIEISKNKEYAASWLIIHKTQKFINSFKDEFQPYMPDDFYEHIKIE